MAITIKLEPQAVQPAYNEIITVFDSTKKSEPNFEYIIDASVDGRGVSRIKLPSNIQGYGILDLHRHIENYVTNQSLAVYNSTSLFEKISGTYVYYEIALSESYRIDLTIASVSDTGGFATYQFSGQHYLSIGDKINVTNSTDVGATYDGTQTITAVPSTTSVVTTRAYNGTATGDAVIFDNSSTIIPSATAFTGTKYAYNAALPWLDVPNWDYTDYILDTSTPGKFLSTLPATNTVSLDDRIWNNFYNNTSGVSNYLEVVSDQGTFRVANPYTSTFPADTKFLTVGIGPWNLLNTVSTVTTVSGALPMITAATTSYTVKMVDASGTPTSETVTFNMDSPCSKFEKFSLLYIDPFSSLLNVNFTLAHKKKASVNRSTFRKNYGSYDASANTFGWNSYDRNLSQLDVDITDTYTIQTDWVTEAVGAQIEQLIESPEVYHLTETGDLYAINIDTKSLDIKQRLTDQLFNYTISFKYTFKNTVQRG